MSKALKQAQSSQSHGCLGEAHARQREQPVQSAKPCYLKGIQERGMRTIYTIQLTSNREESGACYVLSDTELGCPEMQADPEEPPKKIPAKIEE